MTLGTAYARTKVRRIIVLASIAASTAATSVLLTGSLATAARASSSGCTGVSDGITCFYVNGTGTWVDSFVQSRDKFSLPSICNYYARFRVWNSAGTKYFDQNTSYHQGCFYSWRATRTLNVWRYFDNNSRACGTWYENGGALGTACESIYR